jgi:hypothetical protein
LSKIAETSGLLMNALSKQVLLRISPASLLLLRGHRAARPELAYSLRQNPSTGAGLGVPPRLTAA